MKSKGGDIIILTIYVDDITVAGNNKQKIDETKVMLDRFFSMKDLSKLKYFLGLEISHSKKGTFVHQKKYILDILK